MRAISTFEGVLRKLWSDAKRRPHLSVPISSASVSTSLPPPMKKITTPASRKRVRAWCTLIDSKKREYCPRQFCWVEIEQMKEGTVIYRPDRVQTFKPRLKRGQKVAFLYPCWFSSAKGREFTVILHETREFTPGDTYTLRGT